MLLLFNSLCRRALRPFISSTSGQRKRVYTDSSIALPSWTDCDTVRAPPSVHTPDLSWKCVGVPSLCWDQKCPSASCGFSSWEVFISNRAGSLTCEGIFCPDSSNECQTRAITRPHAAHTEITPFSLRLPFSLMPPALALSPALFFLSPGNYHQACQEACRGGCHTAS